MLRWLEPFCQVKPSRPIDVAADDSGTIAGLIMVVCWKRCLATIPTHIEAIVVDPRARSTGLRKRLMRHCEARVRELGATSLTLHVFQRNAGPTLYAAEDFNEELIRAIKWLD